MLRLATREICARLQRQKGSPYTLKVSVRCEALWQLRHVDADLLVYLGAGQQPCVELFQQSRTSFSFSESWARVTSRALAPMSTCSMAPAGTCVTDIVGVKRQRHSLVYPRGIQLVFVDSMLSLLILTSCPTFLTDSKLYRFTEISGPTPDAQATSSPALTIV